MMSDTRANAPDRLEHRIVDHGCQPPVPIRSGDSSGPEGAVIRRDAASKQQLHAEDQHLARSETSRRGKDVDVVRGVDFVKPHSRGKEQAQKAGPSRRRVSQEQSRIQEVTTCLRGGINRN